MIYGVALYIFVYVCMCVCPAVCWTVWACTSTLYPTSAASRSSSSFRLRSWWWLVAPARRTEASRSHMAMGCYGSKLVTTKIKPSEYAPRSSWFLKFHLTISHPMSWATWLAHEAMQGGYGINWVQDLRHPFFFRLPWAAKHALARGIQGVLYHWCTPCISHNGYW
jgi:hypothetical protein